MSSAGSGQELTNPCLAWAFQNQIKIQIYGAYRPGATINIQLAECQMAKCTISPVKFFLFPPPRMEFTKLSGHCQCITEKPNRKKRVVLFISCHLKIYFSILFKSTKNCNLKFSFFSFSPLHLSLASTSLIFEY